MSDDKKEKGKHGGYRHGLNEPTKPMRIPIALEDTVKQLIDEYRQSKGLDK
ncbi:MAG: hypothetical protein ACK5RE_17950 [Pseudanabaena sp.]|jgi:hypothetical protein